MKMGFSTGRISALARTWMRAAGAAAAGIALAPAIAQQAQSQQPQSQLPGGAQSITETYQDWQMVCGQPQGVKQCAVAQQQTDSKTGQRILGVELRPQGDKAEGILLLPFGLTLDKGVAIRVGEAEVASGLRFKTCLLAGCLVPLSFDAKTLAALRKAPTLTVNAVGDADQAVPFSISLKGFGPAFDRAIALAK
jgi:invasion protein IalB